MSASGHDELTPFRGAGQFKFDPRPEALVYQGHDYTWEQVARVLRKNLRFALLFACGLTGIVLLGALLQKDFYKPTARLDIAPPGSGIKTVHEIESPSEADNLDYLETQVQILESDALAVSVIRVLHLDRNPEFADDQQVKGLLPTKTKEVASGVVPSELAILQEQLDLANLTPAESVALEKFRRNLSVASVRNTRLIEISFSSHESQLAQLITNTLVTKFIEQNYRHRYTTTMEASAWLSSQLSDLRRKVEESGQAVASYQKKYGLVEVDDRDVPMSQLMNEVNHQLSDAQAGRIEAEAFLRMIDEGHGEAVPALRDDKLYQDLMAHYSDLRTQLAQTRTVYGEANINVQKLQVQIAEVSLQIDAERNRAIGRTRSSYSASVQREKLMMQERDKLRADMGYMSSQLTSYHMLKNEANANAQLYNTLQSRLQEAGIYAGLGSSNIRVVDLAMNLRKATGPHRFLVVTFGAILSGLVAIVLSLARESFHNTVRTPHDVKFWTGLPSLALLPAMDRAILGGTLPPGTGRKFSARWQMPKETGELAGVSIMKSLTPESEAMRDLRTSLLKAKQGQGPRVILISSPMEGEGKTTVAVNFALALAQLGRTCLVDADLRQPSVAQAFKIQVKGGLTDHLKKSSSLITTLVYPPEHENLAILPSGKVAQNPADILSSREMENLLDTLKKFFDYIVIDSPPVIPFSDARFLSSLVDEVVLVGRYGVTTRRAMQRTAELLCEVNAPVAGVVLNGVDLSSPDYNYYTYGYRRWRGKGREESLLNGTGTNGSSDGGSADTMSAHA
jgi:capsular exopolysaccharide synthesis family protein